MVLWNSVPRDWEDPDGWPARALADIERLDWTLVVLHDVPTGAMRALPRFLDALAERQVTVVSELPPACVPIRSRQSRPADRRPGRALIGPVAVVAERPTAQGPEDTPSAGNRHSRARSTCPSVHTRTVGAARALLRSGPGGSHERARRLRGFRHAPHRGTRLRPRHSRPDRRSPDAAEAVRREGVRPDRARDRAACARMVLRRGASLGILGSTRRPRGRPPGRIGRPRHGWPLCSRRASP